MLKKCIIRRHELHCVQYIVSLPLFSNHKVMLFIIQFSFFDADLKLQIFFFFILNFNRFQKRKLITGLKSIKQRVFRDESKSLYKCSLSLQTLFLGSYFSFICFTKILKGVLINYLISQVFISYILLYSIINLSNIKKNTLYVF